MSRTSANPHAVSPCAGDRAHRRRALALQPAPSGDGVQLGGWQFREASTFDASAQLFPASWREFSLPAGAPIAAQCHAFSPVIPGDLDTASLPVALFDWQISNSSDEAVDCSLLFHWANLNNWFDSFGEGRPERRNMGKINREFKFEFEGDGVRGVVLDRRRVNSPPEEGVGQWAIALAGQDGVAISVAESFDGLADNTQLWQQFTQDGSVPESPAWLADGGFRTEETGLPTAAICARFTLPAGGSRTLRFALSWDLPTLRFGYGREWRRWYTQQWGSAGQNAAALAIHALTHADRWISQIADWHRRSAERLGPAPHQAGFALNELYLLVDGATVLTAPGDAAGNPYPAQFALLECPDYPYYNTMDLWVYAAEAVVQHWPQLAGLVIDNYAGLIATDDATPRKAIFDERRFVLQVAGAVPHDVGAPEEDPFVQANGYALKDSTGWKDLGSRFVLATWRAGQQLGSAWRRQHYPAVRQALRMLQQFDRDGDGLIENDGIPDQTFDNIPMRGVSAYCGGLWLAA